MSLSVFEQPWTQTLEVTEATLTPSDDSSAITTLVGASAEPPCVRLDAAERFRQAARDGAALLMVGEVIS
jgi:hypothetical protein